jgi:tetratricopeptide (TPR) repeat protein
MPAFLFTHGTDAPAKPAPLSCLHDLTARRLLTASLLGVLLAVSGCATTDSGDAPAATTNAALAPPPSAAEPAVAAVDAGEAGGSDEAQGEEEQQGEPENEPEIEYGNFNEDQLARLILAELAGQRGQNHQALEEYVALARETSNLSIIQRAMRIAIFSREPQVAMEMAEMWLAQEPDSPDARQTVALELVSIGRYRDAFRQFAILLERGLPVDFRLLSARVANDENASLILQGLVNDYEALLQRYPANDSLRLSLTHLYQQNKQPQQALALVQQLLQEAEERARNDTPAPQQTRGPAAPNAGDLIVLEVQLLDMLEERERSLRRLQQGVRSHPTHKDLRYMYGRRLIVEQDYPAARAEFAVLVEQNPKDYDLMYSLALLSMEVNMYAEAKNYLQRLVLNGQKTDDSHYYLGFIAGQENETTQAIEHYQLVRGGSNFMQAQRNLTQLMVRSGRYEEVRTHLQNLRFRNADLNIPLLSLEANILIEEKKFDEAKTVLNSAVGAYPNNVQLLFLRSVLSQEINDLALMETDLRKIILLEPQSPVAYNSLGYTLADRTNRYQEAHELIQKAVELAPDDPAILDSLGWVQYKLGLYQEARDNLDRAFELYPDAEVAAHLGEVLWVMGDRSAATRVWRNALQTQPDSVHVRNTMQRLNPSEDI